MGKQDERVSRVVLWAPGVTPRNTWLVGLNGLMLSLTMRCCFGIASWHPSHLSSLGRATIVPGLARHVPHTTELSPWQNADDTFVSVSLLEGLSEKCSV